MGRPSSRIFFVCLCVLSGLVVTAFSSISRNMPPHSPVSKRRRISVHVGSSDNADDGVRVGKLEELKQKEIELSKLLAEVRREKISELRAKPLKIGTWVVPVSVSLCAALVPVP